MLFLDGHLAKEVGKEVEALLIVGQRARLGSLGWLVDLRGDVCVRVDVDLIDDVS